MEQIPHRKTSRSAFSLIELLTVTTILLVLMALMIPSVGHLVSSSRLTRDGGRLVDEIHSARALAQAKNLPVELWLLSLPQPASPATTTWNAARLRFLLPDGGTEWASKMMRLSDGLAFAPADALSSCIGGQTAQSVPSLPTAAQGAGLRFYPNGRVEAISPTPAFSLSAPLTVLIAPDRDVAAGQSQLPANFVMVAIDPRNGRVVSYRP